MFRARVLRREEEPEEDAGDDHEVDFGDEKLAETVEDLLK